MKRITSFKEKPEPEKVVVVDEESEKNLRKVIFKLFHSTFS